MSESRPADFIRQGASARGSARRGPPGVRRAAELRPSSPERSADAAQASLALHNLRGVAIVFVLMMHAFIAYLGSVDVTAGALDQPPYHWLAFPVLDSRRWLGFDVFCAWQDVYLMALMFFLSGVFAGPSLDRDGSLRFLSRRLFKLGGSLLLGLTVVMPVALYPVYRLSAPDPNLIGYGRAYLALPFLPNGPMWFLWVLLALDGVAAAFHRPARRVLEAGGAIAASLESRPLPAFAVFAALAFAAYAPLAAAFTPWRWLASGPFALQLSRPLLYAAYFFLGLIVGRRGLGRGILRADGFLADRWRALLGLCLAALFLWMGLAWLSLKRGGEAEALELLLDASLVVAGLFGVLFALSAAFRFGRVRRPLVGAVADKALPLYLLHYAPVVWIQYGLLDLPLPAVAKGALAFIGALAISWSLAALWSLAVGMFAGSGRGRPGTLLASPGRR